MKSFVSLVVITLAASSATPQQANPILQGQAQQPQVQTTPNDQVAVQAQQPSQQPQQPSFIALRVVGSQVRSTAGAQLGRIEEVLLNRANGTVGFAVIAAGAPARTARVVPVPWSMLTYAWDQSQAGGPAGANQVFVANLDAQRLAQAPALDRTRAGMDASLAAASTFFGAPTTGFGATGNASTTFFGGTNQTFGTTNQMTVSTNPPPVREFGPGSGPPFTPLQTNFLPATPQQAPNDTQNPPTSNPGAGTPPPTQGTGKSGTPVPGAGRPPPSPGTGARPSSGGSAPPASAPGGTR
jgi:hypothetical protein